MNSRNSVCLSLCILPVKFVFCENSGPLAFRRVRRDPDAAAETSGIYCILLLSIGRQLRKNDDAAPGKAGIYRANPLNFPEKFSGNVHS